MLIQENESGSLTIERDRSEAFQLQQEDVARGAVRAKIRRHERELAEEDDEINGHCGCMAPPRRRFRSVVGDILGSVLRGKK